jgi:hypothetical protein
MDNKELWAFLFLVGTLLFNWPLLGIFNLSLPFYIFAVWGFFIIAIGLVISRTGGLKKKDV